MDLTVEGVRAEVARLMRYHPSQFTMSDIALHKGDALHVMSDDNALTLCTTHVKFACVTVVESKVDKM